jgi:hypothetical protein
MLKPGGQLYIHDVILEQNMPPKLSRPLSISSHLPGETFSREMQKAIFSKSVQPMTGSWTGYLLARDIELLAKLFTTASSENTIVLEMRAISLNRSEISE